MSFFVGIFMVGLLLGFIAVASNPSPYYAALGLVVVSAVGCGLLAMSGGCFLPLVIFLIYLGGMMVVFAYCSALASDVYPEAFGAPRIVMSYLVYLLGLIGGAGCVMGGWYGGHGVGYSRRDELEVVREDLSGSGLIYSVGGRVLAVAGGALLLTLFSVLELVRGLVRGALRALDG